MRNLKLLAVLALIGTSTTYTFAQDSSSRAVSPGNPSGTTNFIPIWTGSRSLGNSAIYQAGGNIGLGTTAPASKLDVVGDINLNGSIHYQTRPVIQFLNNLSSFSIGASSLPATSTGFYNTAVGDNTLSRNTSGGGNAASGYNAMVFNVDGMDNTASGAFALNQNVTGNNNTAFGWAALLSNTAGSNNIALGYQAANNVSGNNSNNIHLGSQGLFGDNASIRIGTPGTQTAFFVAGVRGASTGANDAVPVMIDSNGQLGTVSSSRRFKEGIQDMGDVSNGLMRLRPVTFRYTKPFADGSKPTQYGLIAEEVAEVYPDLVVHSADHQVETVKYQVLDTLLLNEVQRQQAQIKSLKEEIQSQQDRMNKLEAAFALVAPLPARK